MYIYSTCMYIYNTLHSPGAAAARPGDRRRRATGLRGSRGGGGGREHGGVGRDDILHPTSSIETAPASSQKRKRFHGLHPPRAAFRGASRGASPHTHAPLPCPLKRKRFYGLHPPRAASTTARKPHQAPLRRIEVRISANTRTPPSPRHDSPRHDAPSASAAPRRAHLRTHTRTPPSPMETPCPAMKPHQAPLRRLEGRISSTRRDGGSCPSLWLLCSVPSF